METITRSAWISLAEARTIAVRNFTATEADMFTDILVEQVAGGFTVDAVVYAGKGPFETIGTAEGFITYDGKLLEFVA